MIEGGRTSELQATYRPGALSYTAEFLGIPPRCPEVDAAPTQTPRPPHL